MRRSSRVRPQGPCFLPACPHAPDGRGNGELLLPRSTPCGKCAVPGCDSTAKVHAKSDLVHRHGSEETQSECGSSVDSARRRMSSIQSGSL